jgi:hypothetical protein
LRTFWFFLLTASICLEGLGRRYLPQVPAVAFYLLKDVVLLFGFLMFRPPVSVSRFGSYLYRGFAVFWVAAFGWTLLESLNPAHKSVALAALGLRAYWLWWLAPVVIAGILQSAHQRRKAIFILAFLSIGIAGLAVAQFVSPPDSAINVYTVIDGQELHASEAGIVAATGRARVASTFAFISGFADFTILVPALLLSFGIESTDKRLRWVSLAATLATAAAVPMSGSRSSVVFGLMVLGITCWTAGLFFTVIGRRILIGAVLGLVVAGFAFPDAMSGVQTRFADTEETTQRFVNAATALPPVALWVLDYPFAGLGTGMLQNAAVSMGIFTSYPAEIEVHRYLVELGVIGFLLIWVVKLGLMFAFWRAYKILKRARRRGSAGAALSYAAVTFWGNLTFDHIWQALFFMGSGFILAETKAAYEALRAEQAKTVEAGPPAISLTVERSAALRGR